MQGQPLRMVQVGLGSFGRSWLAVAQAARGVELVGVVDPVPEALTWARDDQGVPAEACFSSFEEALAAVDFDAALVVTPPETHRSVVTDALTAGKQVLVEKPLATTLPDARALIDVADRSGRVVMVSQNYRFRRPARAAQAVVSSGTLGEVLAVKVCCRRDTRALFPRGGFRYLMRHPYVLDMSIHHFDLLRALTGQNVRQVFARSWRVPDSPYVHDPAAVALLELDGGATVTYQGDWATFDQETSWNGDWEIVGERGRLLWRGGEEDATTGEILVQRWGEPLRPVEQPELADVDRAGTLQAFRQAIAAAREPETSARDNINSLAVVLTCVDSIERGTAVAIDQALSAT